MGRALGFHPGCAGSRPVTRSRKERLMGEVIVSILLGGAVFLLFFYPLSKEEKDMPDIKEEYLEKD